MYLAGNMQSASHQPSPGNRQATVNNNLQSDSASSQALTAAGDAVSPSPATSSTHEDAETPSAAQAAAASNAHDKTQGVESCSSCFICAYDVAADQQSSCCKWSAACLSRHLAIPLKSLSALTLFGCAAGFGWSPTDAHQHLRVQACAVSGSSLAM